MKAALYKFMLFLLLLFSIEALSQIPSVEYEALKEFYNQLNGDNWYSKWDISKNDVHEGSWHGIKVEDNHVVEISLENNRLKGVIPLSISNLKYLKKLALDGGNDLGNSDLGCLEGLTSLEYLKIKGCKLRGSISPSIGKLKKIYHLDLSYNDLDTIPLLNEIGELKKLSILNLESNNFTSLPESIINLTNLKTLNIGRNRILDINQNILNSIANIDLNLRGQKFEVPNFKVTGNDTIIRNIPRITRYNEDKKDFSYLPLFKLYHKKEYSENIIKDTIRLDSTGNILFKNDYFDRSRQDKEIYLEQLNGAAATSLIKFHVDEIKLPKVSDEEHKALLDFYEKTNGDYWINNNNWNKSNDLDKGAWFGLSLESGHVSEIRLNKNRLQGYVPESFSNLLNLKKIDLDGYCPPPGGAGSINFNETYYCSNNLLGTNINVFANLKKLERLDLNSCNIKGELSDEWKNLEQLKFIKLNKNSIHSIKKALPVIKKADVFEIKYQNLSMPKLVINGQDFIIDPSDIPDVSLYNDIKKDFSFVPNFTLYKKNQKLADSLQINDQGKYVIPSRFLHSSIFLKQTNGAAIGSVIRFDSVQVNLPNKVPEDEYLALVDFYKATKGGKWHSNTNWNIKDNDLHKTEWYGVKIQNGHVTEINLPENNIKGYFPKSFENLKHLQKIQLSDFRSEHTLDSLTNISNLKSLEYLYLSGCALEFKLPSDLLKLENLVELRLDNNKISGKITKDFENLKKLKSLYLSENSISDIEVLLDAKIELNVKKQKLNISNIEYLGKDILLDSTLIPRITRYNREKNDFSHNPDFLLKIKNGTLEKKYYLETRSDFSVLIPNNFLKSITKTSVITLEMNSYQAAAYETSILLENINIKLPPVPDEEYQALVDFYNATNEGDGWNVKWDTSENNLNEGAWYGLTLENGHVTGVNLQDNNIKGKIPDSFKNLKYLKILNLSGEKKYNQKSTHDLSKADLSRLSALKKLEVINLEYCNINSTVSKTWNSLDKLNTLVLDYNGIENIDASFSDLKINKISFKDQTVKKDTIVVKSDEIEFKPPLYSVLNKVNDSTYNFNAENEFRLYVNNDFNNIRTAFSNNGKVVFNNINKLNLKENDTIEIRQKNGLASGTRFIYTHLYFGKPLVNEEFEVLKKIYASTQGENWINKWDISVNNLHEKSWYGVLLKEGHIVGLKLAYNNLNGSLPKEITKLKFLKTLNIEGNKVSGVLPADIHLLTNLEVIDLGFNSLSGVVPPKLLELKKLRKFSISNNQYEGAIPKVLLNLSSINYLDISGNRFQKLTKKPDYTDTEFINFSNQKINYNTILSAEGKFLKVNLDSIVKYDLKKNDYSAKNDFALLVNNLTHDETTINDSGDIIFNNVRITEIPQDATISVRQTTGSFLNSEFTYSGIEDKSNVQVVDAEYQALVAFYNALNGESWTTTWNTSANDMHINKWFGVSTYDGHIVEIDLPNNNLSGSIPNIFDKLPNLYRINVSSNKITGLKGAIPSAIEVLIENQSIEKGNIVLNTSTAFKDNTINRYNHAQGNFKDQTYRLDIGTYSKNITITENGLKLVDVGSKWNVKNGQAMSLTQISGDARKSIFNYTLSYDSGEVNMDGEVNVLDLQTTINHIMDNYVKYFNFYAADIKNDETIDVLDVVRLTDTIQNNSFTKSFKTNYNEIVNTNHAQLSVTNNNLVLNTNTHEVASFQIVLEGISKAEVEEQLSNSDFSVSIKEKENKLSIIAYSLTETLKGEQILAKIKTANVKVVSVMLSNVEAEEVPCDIDNTLSVLDVNTYTIVKTANYPNPFTHKTVIEFSSPKNQNHAQLNVYDIRGGLLFMDDVKLHQGLNHYIFYRKKIPEGVYFYTITSDSLSIKGEMVIN